MDLKAKIILDTSQFQAQLDAFRNQINGAKGVLDGFNQVTEQATAATEDLGQAAASVGEASQAATDAVGKTADAYQKAGSAAQKMGASTQQACSQAKISAEQMMSILSAASTALVGTMGAAAKAYGGEKMQAAGGYLEAAAGSAISLGAALAPIGPVGMVAGAAIGAVTGSLTPFFDKEEEAREAAKELANTLKELGLQYDGLDRKINRAQSLDALTSMQTELQDKKAYLLQKRGTFMDGLTDVETEELKQIGEALEFISDKMADVKKQDFKGIWSELEEYQHDLNQQSQRQNWLTQFNKASDKGDQQHKELSRLRDEITALEEQLNAAQKQNDLARGKQLAEQIKELRTWQAQVAGLDITQKVEKKIEPKLKAAAQSNVDSMMRIGATVGAPPIAQNKRIEEAQLQQQKLTAKTCKDLYELQKQQIYGAKKQTWS